MKPRIAITLGDPAGIGPEIVSKALRDSRVHRACQPIVLGNKSCRLKKGRPSREGGRWAIEALEAGLDLVNALKAEALVTAPVSKESFDRADYGFPGHTEWLEERTRAKEVAMLMVAGSLRAVLMTRHIPLSQVSKHLTPSVITTSARLAYRFLSDVIPAYPFPSCSSDGYVPCSGTEAGIQRNLKRMDSRFRGNDDSHSPRIVLCGLNPHAGDRGLIGLEEEKIFRPALRTLKKEGIQVSGPISADAVFAQMAQGKWDLALAAYHDQGMIPLKLYAPDRLVNVTIGLPFIRTSPGHGTAYDIAGKGVADPRPMIEAILLAAQYSEKGA